MILFGDHESAVIVEMMDYIFYSTLMVLYYATAYITLNEILSEILSFYTKICPLIEDVKRGAELSFLLLVRFANPLNQQRTHKKVDQTIISDRQTRRHTDRHTDRHTHHYISKNQ